MADIYKQMTDVRANLEKNAFDLSERHLFTAKCGQLLPIYNKQVVPGDYFEIDPISFLRTMPLNTANFARMRQHIDVFFVPYCQLWHPFPEMKYQRADETSTVYRQGLMSPYMTMYDLYKNVLCDQSKQDRFGFKEVFNRIRLCDLLGYGSLRNMVSHTNTDVADPSEQFFGDSHVTIWPWLAYQKIWYDWYRNPYWDVTQATASFNVDDVDTSSTGDSNIVTSRFGANAKGYQLGLDGIFTLRYRQWKKDYFTGTFPERQFGGISMISPSGVFTSAASVTGSSSVLNTNSNPSLLAVNSSVSSSSYQNRTNWTLEDSISALDVRRMELLQIWKEKTMRAGYRTEAQQMAHFGVRSKYIPDNHVQYLGGISDVINISEVVSTSLYDDASGTNDQGLGQLGGKGTSLANGQKIKFHAQDDGVLMVMYSILPESEYNAFGLAKEHTRIDPFDYFTPAFQNLGFETVDEIQGFVGAGANQIVGYAPPYYDMKMGIDKAHGEFITAVSGIPIETTSPDQTLHKQIGSLSMFDTARRDTNYLNINFYYVNPHVTDSLFHSSCDNFDSSDPFYINCYLSIKAVRPMSVLGLPNF